ncbi:alpha/beta hydrolase [Paenibacillus filicis]|uniref:Alpha/beta hydrolase n=1 Tax=Paenibacillus gyeongsangnamensis TaxID=3388067 RepID=A0ABT4QAU8_9BACL|nr:alpha/beta hydrolase [Paenibacillus filicis]MCZ8514013.1 alpha/beta hydrolase [Paenibacillus filicis]
MGYYVEVERGVKVYVEDTGYGRPVVLIHGWPVNHRMFEYQLSQLPKYGFRCITPDLRGFGRSDCPWAGYGYDRLADDIRAVVDALRLPSYALAGFSVGGAIAIRYMSRHQDPRVSQLLLLGAAAPSFTQRQDFPYGMKPEEVDAFLAMNDKDRPLMLEMFGELFFASKVSAPFKQWFHGLGLEAFSHGTAAVLLSLRNEDLRPDLPRIRVPATIFHGTLDRICPFPLALLMNQGIAGSRLLRFEHSGHGLFYDELELFNERLQSVLAGSP